MWHIRTYFSRHGGAGWMVGLDDLRGLFQPMILWLLRYYFTSKNLLRKSMILNTLHSSLCIVRHKCTSWYVHFSYLFYTPESSCETAQSLVSNKHLYQWSANQQRLTASIHSEKVPWLPKRRLPKRRFVCCPWEQVREARSHARGSFMAHFPLASVTRDRTHTKGNIVHLPKSLLKWVWHHKFCRLKEKFLFLSSALRSPEFLRQA